MSQDMNNLTFKDKYIQSKTWQEKAIVISLYHSIMCLKYKTWNITDTALHFEVSRGLVSENIKLATAIDQKNRKVINSKTREDALKFVERRRYTQDRNNHIVFDDEE